MARPLPRDGSTVADRGARRRGRLGRTDSADGGCRTRGRTDGRRRTDGQRKRRDTARGGRRAGRTARRRAGCGAGGGPPRGGGSARTGDALRVRPGGHGPTPAGAFAGTRGQLTTVRRPIRSPRGGRDRGGEVATRSESCREGRPLRERSSRTDGPPPGRWFGHARAVATARRLRGAARPPVRGMRFERMDLYRSGS